MQLSSTAGLGLLAAISFGCGTGASVEDDPLFSSSPAAAVTTQDISRWNEAAVRAAQDAGMLAAESDPVFAASAAAAVDRSSLASWNAAAARGDHHAAGYLTLESDPFFAASAAAKVSAADLISWSNAASWGDHRSAGYLTGESDPLFAASAAATISPAAIASWSAASSWGNHASAGYQTAAAFSATPAAGITSTQLSHWDSAWAWGNHATAGYQTTAAFNATPAASITSTNIGSWNAAMSWGNHATAGYLTTESDPKVGANTTDFVPRWNGTALVTGIIKDTGSEVTIKGGSLALDQDNFAKQPVGVPGTDVWQSFTPASSGLLTRIEINGAYALNHTFSIYAGEGTGGAMLTSQSASAPLGVQSITLTTPVAVTAGTKYTWRVNGGASWSPLLSQWPAGTYAGGVLASFPDYGLLSNLDASFRTFVEASPALTVSAAGNVGVGVVVAARKLHVGDVMRLEPLPGPPAAPVKGDLYMNGTLNQLCYFNDTSWVCL